MENHIYAINLLRARNLVIKIYLLFGYFKKMKNLNLIKNIFKMKIINIWHFE